MGTVMVVPSAFACMTTWLPRRRTSAKPCCERIVQASVPERTRSLPNGDFELCNEDVAVKAGRDFGAIGRLEEKLKSLSQV